MSSGAAVFDGLLKRTAGAVIWPCAKYAWFNVSSTRQGDESLQCSVERTFNNSMATGNCLDSRKRGPDGSRLPISGAIVPQQRRSTLWLSFCSTFVVHKLKFGQV
jgi:hypothetical protein